MENEKQNINELEEELKKLSPVKSQINRDDLFFKAGMAAGMKQVQSKKQLRVWQSYSAVMTLTTLIGVGWIMQNSILSEKLTETRNVVSDDVDSDDSTSRDIKSNNSEVSIEKQDISIRQRKVLAEKIALLKKNLAAEKSAGGMNRVKQNGPASGTYLALRELYLGDGNIDAFIENDFETESLADDSDFQDKNKPVRHRELMQKFLDISI